MVFLLVFTSTSLKSEGAAVSFISEHISIKSLQDVVQIFKQLEYLNK